MSSGGSPAVTRTTIQPRRSSIVQSPNIPSVLSSVAAVLIAVVLDGDFEVFPSHVEIGDNVAELVTDGNLRLGSWKSRINQQQPKPRFLGRLRSGIHQVECSLRPANTAPSLVALHQRPHLRCLHLGRSRQSIDRRHRVESRIPASQVEHRAGRCSHRNTVDQLELILFDAIAANPKPGKRVSVGVDHFQRPGGINPFGAV